MHKKSGAGRKALAALLSTAVTISVLPSDFLLQMGQQAKAAEITLSNPRTENGVSTWDCIYFGNYWQNDTNGDGKADKNDEKEPIKWRVLSVDGDDAFLLADRNLDCQPYDLQAKESTTWETCTLRSWLNGYDSSSNNCGVDYSNSNNNFIDAAFSTEEQSAIRNTKVVNYKDTTNYGVNQEAGNDTIDKIYLLSIIEAGTASYGFDSIGSTASNTRSVTNTAYTERLVVESKDYFVEGFPDVHGYPAICWWLRSIGPLQLSATLGPCMYQMNISNSYGSGFFNYGAFPQNCRPVLHLDLSADALYSYAGTVSSDGKSAEVEPTILPTEAPTAAPEEITTPSQNPTIVPSQSPAVDSEETAEPTQTPAPSISEEDNYVKVDGTPEQGMISQNIYKENYGNWASTVKSYLYFEENGSISRVESTDDGILIENYNPQTFSLLSQKRLNMELPLFGGFYAGEKYNYIVFGQSNLKEDNKVEVCRVVQYDKNWNRISSDGLFGANTYKPFDAGSLRMCEYGDYLYVETCHTMYVSDDGYNHQSNLTLSFCQSTGKITDSFFDIWNINRGYVSHSFNQFIKTDGTDLLAVHHGDAYPRSIVLVKYAKPAGQETFTGNCSNVNILNISGVVGSNYTGVNVGGFEVSSDSYLVAYRSVDQGNISTSKVYNVYVGSIKKTKEGDSLSGSQVDTIKITSFAEGGEYSAANPLLVKVSEERFLLLWELYKGSYSTGNIQYAMLDSTGHMVGGVEECAGAISDCQPVLKNGEVVWYVTDKSAPVFYAIDLASMQLRTIDSNQSANPATYSITSETTGLKNAKAVFSKETGISASDIVTLTITPDNGYVFKDVPTVIAVGAVAEMVTRKQDGTYTCSITGFTKDAVVTVKGSAEPDVPTSTPAAPQPPEPIQTPVATPEPVSTPEPVPDKTPVPTKKPVVKTPKKAVVKSIKNTKGKKITITLKSQSNTTGYQICYSTKSNMKGAKSTTSKENTIVLKGLKKKKTYFIRIRAYNKVSGVKKYGSWSTKVKIKINK